ncbi:MAG: hypothetical protein AB4038_06205 [Prochloraceae cyanobacterium]
MQRVLLGNTGIKVSKRAERDGDKRMGKKQQADAPLGIAGASRLAAIS